MLKTFSEVPPDERLNLQHQIPLKPTQARVLSSHLDAKGDWVMSVKVQDPNIVKAIRAKALTGFSIQGSCPGPAMKSATPDRVAERVAHDLAALREEFPHMFKKSNSEPTEAEWLETLAMARACLEMIKAIPDDTGIDFGRLETLLSQGDQRVAEQMLAAVNAETARIRADAESPFSPEAARELGRKLNPKAAAEQDEAERRLRERTADLAAQRRYDLAQESAREARLD
jgi:hypothetical protein